MELSDQREIGKKLSDEAMPATASKFRFTTEAPKHGGALDSRRVKAKGGCPYMFSMRAESKSPPCLSVAVVRNLLIVGVR